MIWPLHRIGYRGEYAFWGPGRKRVVWAQPFALVAESPVREGCFAHSRARVFSVRWVDPGASNRGYTLEASVLVM